MPRRLAGSELPLDVRRGDSAGRDHAVVVEAVLDALPSPTLLLDADGTVLLANSAWSAAAAFLEDERIDVGVGGNYFAMAESLRDDADVRGMIARLRALSRGERRVVSADYEMPTPEGIRWYHLQASRVDQAGQIVVTHTDVTSGCRPSRPPSGRPATTT